MPAIRSIKEPSNLHRLYPLTGTLLVLEESLSFLGVPILSSQITPLRLVVPVETAVSGIGCCGTIYIPVHDVPTKESWVLPRTALLRQLTVNEKLLLLLLANTAKSAYRGEYTDCLNLQDH